jgi:hypothetical protein
VYSRSLLNVHPCTSDAYSTSVVEVASSLETNPVLNFDSCMFYTHDLMVIEAVASVYSKILSLTSNRASIMLVV